MLYKSGNILIKSGTTYFKQEVKQLTFQVEGDKFPLGFSTGAQAVSYFYILNSGENTVTVNYGDGVSETISSNNSFNFLGSNPHIFQDGNTGRRNITFEFQNTENIRGITTFYTLLYGNLPVELALFPNVEILRFERAYNLEGLPAELSNMNSLKEAVFSITFLDKLNKIPEGLINSPLEKLDGRSQFNLEDITASNFYRINTWANSLKDLRLRNCNVFSVPTELASLTLLENLFLFDNPIEEFPKEIESLVNLIDLRMGGDNLQNTSFIDFSNLTLLERLYLYWDNLNLAEIPTKWVGLKSLSQIGAFNNFITTDARLNEFIPYFYQLVTDNAFVDPTSQAAIASGYPYQFRGISWGHSSLNVDTPIQAPAGFTPGVFFGNAQTNGERVYEMGVNYAHVIN